MLILEKRNVQSMWDFEPENEKGKKKHICILVNETEKMQEPKKGLVIDFRTEEVKVVHLKVLLRKKRVLGLSFW